MVYEADTLMQNFILNWTLSGERLAKQDTALITVPIRFYAHHQQPGDLWLHAIEIVKQSSLSVKRSTEFFTREEDEFEIHILVKREGTDKGAWDQSEADVEDIEDEVERIIKLNFDPLGGLGIWFTSDGVWQNRDKLEENEPYLHRVFVLRLSRILPRKTTAFITYKKGVLIDVSASQGTGLPGTDYQYTEVFNVNARSGFSDFEVVTNDETDGRGIPWHYSGRFNGTIVMESYLKETDLGSGSHLFNQIWKKLATGEQPEVVFLRTFNNNNGKVLTITQTIIFLDFQEIDPPHDQFRVQLLGKIIKPGTYVVV